MGKKTRKTKGGPVDLDKTIGKNLLTARVENGLSQEGLAHLVGVSFQQIQKYEKGTNRIAASRLYEFADALNKPMAWFYDEKVTHYVASPKSKTEMEILKIWRSIKDNALRAALLKILREV